MLGLVRQLQSYDQEAAGPFVVYLPVPLTNEEEDEIFRNLDLVCGVRTSTERPETEMSQGVGTELAREHQIADGDMAAAEQIENEGERFD